MHVQGSGRVLGSSSCLPDVVYSLPLVFRLFSTCLPVVAQMSLLVSQLPLSLELETVTAVRLQHWLNQPHKGYTWDVPRPTVQHLSATSSITLHLAGSNAVPHRRKGGGTF